jgi:hypothetical protein
MISLSDKASGASIGTLTESQLQILVDQLEETDLDDQDYFIDRRTIDMIKTIGADYAALVDVLERAVGDRDAVDIVWSRS